ncbi:MAG: M1 family metallopeptidase [Terriglobales bacterium]
MTERPHPSVCSYARALLLAVFLAGACAAQNPSSPPQPATSAPQAPSTAGPREATGPGAQLYTKLASAGLDRNAIYSVRGAFIDREDLHITLDDGVIGFLKSIDGHVTGAFFEGTGEVLVFPPNLAERGSLALFTGAAVLEDHFQSAYFRFNDDLVAELKPYLQPVEDAQAYYDKWSPSSTALAEADALRLMASFLNRVPAAGDRFFRGRLQSATLGVYDIYYDTLAAEQIGVFRFTHTEQGSFYDVLASFPSRSARKSERSGESERSLVASSSALNSLHIGKFTVEARIGPPQKLSADATLDVDASAGGDRLLFFELSRFLQVSAVEFDGKPVEFLQNVAIEGSALARRGNDIVAVLLPHALETGQRFRLKFTYSGDVLSDAGNGLLYVGERGIWYPNRGMAMADYDLTFHYPEEWTLVATGKLESHSTAAGSSVSHWISERKMPVAGFNLGHYRTASIKSGDVDVVAYAASSLEEGLVRTPVTTPPQMPNPHAPIPPPLPLQPAPDAQVVAQQAARAIAYYVREFGPFPYSSLAITQLPGTLGQSWPGLIYLSSLAFLTREQLSAAHVKESDLLLLSEFMTPHETAHQWWGDLVGWSTYRDQWLVEALANYSAILELEGDHADDCRAFLRDYHDRLLQKNRDGEEVTNAGAVTLGQRLNSSHFPNGYYLISYGRGTWLIHMLRTMLRDGAELEGKHDDPFLRVLRDLRERYSERSISTREFQTLVEQELPRSIHYEERASLDWFFDDWVNGTAIPKIVLKDVRIARHGTSATATLLQSEAPDEMVTSVPIYAETKAGLKLVARAFADGPQSKIRVTVPRETRKLVLDPYDTVLRR